MTEKRTCGRATRNGTPCRRPLQWYELACAIHATHEERDQALAHLRRNRPWKRT